MHTTFWWANCFGKVHLEDEEGDGKIILRLILGK
jgi:hypothetical protein